MTEDIQPIIRFLMKRRGFETFGRLALEMGIHPSTFSVNLQKVSLPGGAPKKFMSQLARALQMGLDELQEVVTSSIAQDAIAHKQLIQQQVSTFDPLNRGYVQEILDLTNRLHSGDTYTLVTCYTPLEFSDSELRDTIFRAIIERGVRFNYVFPDPDLELILEPYVTPDFDAYLSLGKRFKKYKKMLQDATDLSDSDEKPIEFWELNDPILMSPLTKLIYLKRSIFGVTEKVVFTEARIGTLQDHRVMKYWYPVPRYDVLNIVARLDKLLATPPKRR